MSLGDHESEYQSAPTYDTVNAMPDGGYTLKIIGVAAKTNEKKGNDMIVWVFEVVGGESDAMTAQVTFNFGISEVSTRISSSQQKSLLKEMGFESVPLTSFNSAAFCESLRGYVLNAQKYTDDKGYPKWNKWVLQSKPQGVGTSSSSLDEKVEAPPSDDEDTTAPPTTDDRTEAQKIEDEFAKTDDNGEDPFSES